MTRPILLCMIIGMEDTQGMVLKKFIVIEGLDGAGTTTQLHLLEKRALERGIPAYCTWEPSSGPVGLLIRSILAREVSVHPCTLARLFAADRYDHLYGGGDNITARLGGGEYVFCDRYIFSSLAYQSLDCCFEEVFELNRYPLPEHLIFLDVPEAECTRRMALRDREELFEAQVMQKSIRKNYQRAFDRFKDTGMTFHRIDGTMPAGAICEKIWSSIPGLPI